MNLTDIVTPDELRAFLEKAVQRENNEEQLAAWMKRADRLEPLLVLFAETLPGADDRMLRWHMLAMIVAIDEILEYATTKGRIQ